MPRKPWKSVTINEKTKKILEQASQQTGKSESKLATEAIIKFVKQEA